MSNQDSWEKEMEKMIREKGRETAVPENLQPNQVRERLNQQKQMIARRRRNKIGRFCAAAAILLVCGTGVWMRSGGHHLSDIGGRKTADGGYSADSSEKGEDQAKSTEMVEKLSYAKSYKEIRKIRKQIMERSQTAKSVDTFGMSNDLNSMASEYAAPDVAYENAPEQEHSQTNVSVEGIAEADVVHTDGKYIYRLRVAGVERPCAAIDIIQADGGEMKRVGTYHCPRQEDSEGYTLSPQEFFLEDDQLILLSDGYDGNTRITFIDISDRKNPVKTNELTQSGSYEQARIKDGYLYTLSGTVWGRYGGCIAEVVQENQEDQIPCINGKRIPPSGIYIPDGCNTTAFTTITSVKIADGSEFTDSRSIMAEAEELHMTEKSIYFVGDKWMNSAYLSAKKKPVKTTQITKFVYQNGRFIGRASAQVNGSVRDHFAINEYNKTLRIVSSVEYNTGENDNAVYVLDEDLKIIGSIEKLAEGERVYSARFQGDIGYFVTYRETDPLFSVDFSDPHDPKLLGELKIPGFSEYMHFYNDHLLFGLGLEEGKDGERRCVKLSMFDISDPKNVREIHKIQIKGMSYSEALYDYKSVLIDPEKNIIGFGGEGGIDDRGIKRQYLVYSYDEEKGFVCRVNALKAIGEEMIDNDWQGIYTRGLYIGDTIYLMDICSNEAWALDLNTGQCIGKYRPSGK